MKRALVVSPKFERAFRRLVRRNAQLQKRIEDTLIQMEQDVFATSLSTHKLSGMLKGLRAVVATIAGLCSPLSRIPPVVVK